MDIYILTNISITYVNFLNLNYNLLMRFFCVWLYRFSKGFIVNISQRPNYSVPTSESCEVNFFPDMITKPFNAAEFFRDI